MSGSARVNVFERGSCDRFGLGQADPLLDSASCRCVSSCALTYPPARPQARSLPLPLPLPPYPSFLYRFLRRRRCRQCPQPSAVTGGSSPYQQGSTETIIS